MQRVSEWSDPDFTSFWWVFGFCTVLRLMDMTTRGGGGRSLTTEIRSLFCATASTLDQLIGWLLSSRGDGESGHSKWLQYLDDYQVSLNAHLCRKSSEMVCLYVLQERLNLTRGLHIKPAWSPDLPIKEEVFQTGGVGAKHMGKCWALQLRWQWRKLSLQKQNVHITKNTSGLFQEVSIK